MTTSSSLAVLRCVAARRAPCLPAMAAAQQGVVLRSPDGGEVRALIIGIDAYRHVRPLKGAVADAQDIEARCGAWASRDVTTLMDARADRDAVLMAIDRLVAAHRSKTTW